MPVLSLRIFLLACLGLVTACSPLTPVNLLVPNDSYRLLADQPYGDDPRQQLDVYLPQGELDRA